MFTRNEEILVPFGEKSGVFGEGKIFVEAKEGGHFPDPCATN